MATPRFGRAVIRASKCSTVLILILFEKRR
jgi:hypothetical protein